MTRRALHATAVLFAWGGLTAWSAAGIIAYDGFDDYQTGAAVESASGVGLSGGLGWAGAWNVNNADRNNVSIQSADLGYGPTNAMQIDGKLSSSIVNLANRPFAANADTLYLSFNFMTTSGDGRDDDFIQIGVGDRIDQPQASIGHRRDKAINDHGFFARSSKNYQQSTFTGEGTTVDTAHLLVARISKTAGGNYDSVEMWVDPANADLGEPDAVRFRNSGADAVDQFLIRNAFLENGDRYLIDNVTIADAPSFALSSVPEPATIILVAITALFMVHRLRWHRDNGQAVRVNSVRTPGPYRDRSAR